MNFDVNFVPIIISAIVFMIVGTLWYGPFWGKKWMTLVNLTQASKDIPTTDPRRSMPFVMLLTFISALITSFVLAVLLKSLLITTIGPALTLAFFVWLGFVAMTFSHRVLFERSSPLLYVINASQYLAAFVLGTFVLVLWPW
jgi:hypothetical protein